MLCAFHFHSCSNNKSSTNICKSRLFITVATIIKSEMNGAYTIVGSDLRTIEIELPSSSDLRVIEDHQVSKCCSEADDLEDAYVKMDILYHLPEEVRINWILIFLLKQIFFCNILQITLYILSFLGPNELLTCALVSHTWLAVSEDKKLWRDMYASRDVVDSGMWPTHPSSSRTRVHNECLSKTAYLRHMRIRRNWKKMPLSTDRIVLGKDSSTCVVCHQQLVGVFYRCWILNFQQDFRNFYLFQNH